MKKSRFTESQIVKILKEYESGIDAVSTEFLRQRSIIGGRSIPAWKPPS